MARAEIALKRARAAYTRAHLVAGLRGVVVAGALIAVAVTLHRITHATWFAAGILAITLGVLGWRGGPMRRGSLAGVLAGLPPMFAPVFVSLVSHGGLRCAECPTMPSLACTLTCFGTAALVGVVVGNHATRDASPSRFAFAATLTAALTGALGCGTTGIGGALGIAVGLVAGGVTGWVATARAA